MTTLTQPTTDTTVAARAVLVDLSIRKWTASTRDKEATTEVTNNHKAASDVGHFYKQLLDPRFTAEVDSVATAAGADHRRRTLPYTDNGSRLLKATALDDYGRAMREWEGKYMAAVDRLIEKWDEAVEDGIRRQGTMGKRSDYPTKGQLRDRYAFGFIVLPVPVGQDLRIDIADEQLARLQAEIDRTTRAAYAATTANIAERIKTRIAYTLKKLTGTRPDGRPDIFRDSLIENIREDVDFLPSLNLTDDPRIAELIDRMRRDLADLSPEGLRINGRLRVETTKKAEAILSEASAIAAEADAIASKMADFI
jgi:hypothetical protein